MSREIARHFSNDLFCKILFAMNVRTIWTNEDFEEMGWHDSYVHAVSFPTSDNGLSLDLDYLFKWVVNHETNLFDFWVSPCILTFMDVSASFKN